MKIKIFKRKQKAGAEVLGIVRNVADELRVSRFAPCDEELAFSKDGALPPVYVETPEGQAVLSGFVDRVDVLDEPGGKYFRVIDYKTGHKDFDYTDLLCGKGLTGYKAYEIKTYGDSRTSVELKTLFDIKEIPLP